MNPGVTEAMYLNAFLPLTASAEPGAEVKVSDDQVASHFEAHKDALFKATRKMMEAEIATIPNGTYSGEGSIYYDGRHEGSKFQVRVTITVGSLTTRATSARYLVL